MKLAPSSLLALLALFLIAPNAVRAGEDPLTGHWEGAFARLGSIQTVAVDLQRVNGTLAGTFDIPDLGLYGEPLTEIAQSGNELSFKCLYGVFAMQVHADAVEMTGTNPKWNPPVTLHLKRMLRPPSPFVKEEVRFENGDVALAGTLVVPRTPGPHPAIAVVHGADTGDRSNWAYRSFGDFLARQGFAVLLYDRRGEGASGGTSESATFENLAGDAVAAVAFLKSRREIDARRIGLIGSSQGGWLSPMAAARSRDVAFLILNVAPAVTVAEQETDRVVYQMRAEGFSEEEIATAVAYTRLMFEVAYADGAGWPALEAAAKAARQAKWGEIVSLVESKEDLEGWRRQRFDPRPVLERTRVPVLAIYGETDVYVPPTTNVDKMRAYLAKAGNTDVTIRVIPNVGHNMFTGQSLRGGEWNWPSGYWAWDRRSPEFLATIAEWLGRVRAGGAKEQ